MVGHILRLKYKNISSQLPCWSNYTLTLLSGQYSDPRSPFIASHEGESLTEARMRGKSCPPCHQNEKKSLHTDPAACLCREVSASDRYEQRAQPRAQAVGGWEDCQEGQSCVQGWQAELLSFSLSQGFLLENKQRNLQVVTGEAVIDSGLLRSIQLRMWN